MNIIELAYLNMKPYDEKIYSHMDYFHYIMECRTLTIDTGRGTGKTTNLCEFITKYGFKDVCFVCLNRSHIKHTKKTIEIYKQLYGNNKKQNIRFITYYDLKNNSHSIRGSFYDVIIFDANKVGEFKNNIGIYENTSIMKVLKKDGFILKVG